MLFRLTVGQAFKLAADLINQPSSSPAFGSKADFLEDRSDLGDSGRRHADQADHRGLGGFLDGQICQPEAVIGVTDSE